MTFSTILGLLKIMKKYSPFLDLSCDFSPLKPIQEAISLICNQLYTVYLEIISSSSSIPRPGPSGILT